MENMENFDLSVTELGGNQVRISGRTTKGKDFLSLLSRRYKLDPKVNIFNSSDFNSELILLSLRNESITYFIKIAEPV
jgi:hypothetical protein